MRGFPPVPALCLVVALTALALGSCAEAPPREDRWTERMEAFAAEDAARPPAPGGVVFVGSSSVAGWDVAAAFPSLHAVNRGLGGSRAPDVLDRLDRLVPPHRPRAVVVYVGDNDVASGRTPERVRDDALELFAAIHRAAPEARLVVLSIKPSPDRAEYLDASRRANELIRAALADDPSATWVDVFDPMLDDSGAPRPELYEEDGLHLSPAGYELWRSILAPVLQ